MSEIIDNRANRVKTMKSIITRLHHGADPETVKEDMKRLVGETDASEIAAMEQELIEEGTPVDEIQSMCDLHAEVLREITVNPEERTIPPGHPIDTFRLENIALQNAMDRIGSLAGRISELNSKDNAEEWRLELLSHVNNLVDIDKHYSRKENLLFPYLEKYSITGPSQVMWAKDDEVRNQLKALTATLKRNGIGMAELKGIAGEELDAAIAAIKEMIYKEENILLPMAHDALTEEDWGEIFKQSAEIGWCMVAPREGYQPPATAEPSEEAKTLAEKTVPFSTGSLTFEQLQGMFDTLPADLTFVDADDRVRYFTQKKDSIFRRNKAVLGRKIQHCHPPKSVHVVEQILDDFKSGSRDVAEFWINFGGKFVHICYYAVRNADGQYLGTMEVTQDLTPLRGLVGERRLLQYD